MSGVNPFAALVQNDDIQNQNEAEVKNENLKSNESSLNSVLENIFAFTLNENIAIKRSYVYLGNTGCTENKILDFDNLSHCLFERLFSCNKDNPCLLSKNKEDLSVHSKEYETIIYLYMCYKSYMEENDKLHLFNNFNIIKEEILKSTSTAYINPNIYGNQNLYQQMVDILLDDKPYSKLFFKDVCNAIINDEDSDDTTFENIYKEFLVILRENVIKTPLSTFDIKIFNILRVITQEEKFASVFMDLMQPQTPHGIDYTKTLLGALINISILPKDSRLEFEHFSNVNSYSSVESTESFLWEKLKFITDQIHQFLLYLLKCSPIVKEKVLNWFGKCLKSNADREKLWNTQVSSDLFPVNLTQASDGFMLQLGNILLRFCQPFCKDEKILKVDPTYCAVTDDLASSKQIHLIGMSEKTCLLPTEQNTEERLVAKSYNFTTECFFIAHRALFLGFAVSADKVVRLNQELSRIERTYNEAREQMTASNESNRLIETLTERLSKEMSKFFSYNAQLSEPTTLSCLFDLISSTSYWLCQVVLHQDSCTENNYAPLEKIPISFPLENYVPNTLKCIPEFIVENIVCFLVYLMRFCPREFERQSQENLNNVLNFIIMFMGNHGFIKNPHLRAQLAEALEALLPVHKDNPDAKNDPVNYQRTLLFSNQNFKKQVVKSLLEVFVGIEMTGQSVEFEQKFNYRRPMYRVMEYLWDSEDYQYFFKELAEEAEKTMEDVSPPIFLRFINLLMNDAVFLLDESLTNMAKLREMQAARDGGDWENLPERERHQNLNFLNHTGMMARYDNILGRDTITALEKLTSEITIVFTHSTMVDRIAAMLNYFLLNLVGPNKKNFKVKNSKEYSFDPAETVLCICKIYAHLKDNDSFCLAISQDGRSYSSNLFLLAENVLIKIGGGSCIQEIRELAETVAKKAEEYQANEEAIAEAPEHFLDPIMSTVMMDPVILPSSKQIVDRTTIARHLLSDQTDPFNRSPLSMDQVIPHTELAKEITEWIAERRKNR